jgi:phthalate 4,5-dioxygenase
VWTYMGPPEGRPEPPNYEILRVPETHRFVCKTFEECNYLQALEGGLDSTHSSILHTRNGSDLTFLAQYERIIPQVEVRKTNYGYVFSGTRTIKDRKWARISQFIMPAMHLRGTVQQVFRDDVEQPTMDGHVWVPIDDYTTCVYNFTYSYFPAAPLSRAYAEAIEELQGRGKGEIAPDYKPIRNRTNDYMIDRALQKNGSFTGIRGINTQDFALQENMEPIVDRTKEHIGSIDQPIIVARQLLLEATDDVEKGRTPLGAEPKTHEHVRAADDFVALDRDWQEALKEQLLALY